MLGPLMLPRDPLSGTCPDRAEARRRLRVAVGAFGVVAVAGVVGLFAGLFHEPTGAVVGVERDLARLDGAVVEVVLLVDLGEPVAFRVEGSCRRLVSLQGAARLEAGLEDLGDGVAFAVADPRGEGDVIEDEVESDVEFGSFGKDAVLRVERTDVDVDVVFAPRG